MPKTFPKISIIIPCRNEERFIRRCLDSLLSQDYPKERMEILVVNGASEDNTTSIVKEYTLNYSFIKLLENPQKITPISMNIGIKNANGDIVMITGAHSEIAPDYISKCIDALERYGADVAGGSLITKPSNTMLTAHAIALVLSSGFGTGGARFRIGTDQIREADTAFNACYKKDIFSKVGFLNEHLIRSQDMDLSMRIKKAGGKIILVPDAITYYYPKGTLSAFLKHNIADGIWAILPLKFGAPLFKPRHLIPLLFVLGIVGSIVLGFWLPPFMFLAGAVLGLYFAASLFFSLRIAAKEKRLLLAPFLIATFAARHFGYGIGSLVGVLKLVL